MIQGGSTWWLLYSAAYKLRIIRHPYVGPYRARGMSSGPGSSPLSPRGRYSGRVIEIRRSKSGKRNALVDVRHSGKSEVVFVSESKLPRARVGMSVRFRVEPWKKAGTWNWEGFNVEVLERGKIESAAKIEPEARPTSESVNQGKPKFNLDDWQIDDVPIGDGKEFKGKFVDRGKGTYFAGFQSYIKCHEIGDHVFARQDDSIGGSIHLGANVRFKVIVSEDNRGDKQWKAIEWKSNFQRTLQTPPLTVELGQIEGRLEEIEAWLNTNDTPVLAVAKMVSKGTRAGRGQKLKKKISEILPAYQTTEFDWPSGSHKMIRDHVACSVLIHRLAMEEVPTELQEKLKIGVAQSAYERQVKLDQRRWVILGDETGKLGEFASKPMARPSRMLWVVVPPGSALPPLHPHFHGQDPELFGDETLEALETLASEGDRVRSFVFTHEQGTLPEALGKATTAAKVPLLLFWQFTLPLVMEYVVSKAEKKDSVSIYVERMGDENDLPPGGQALGAVVQEFAAFYRRRERARHISWTETRILEKKPIEHAWLGYCDAIGFLNDPVVPEEWRDHIGKIKKTSFEVPFRQDSLSPRIRSLLKATDRPLAFLKSLADIPLEDMRDYVRPFLSTAVSDCVSALNSREWQDLLDHMNLTSKEKKGQNATILIYRHVVIPDVLDELKRDSDKFDFLLAMLGTANHIGSGRSAECIGHLDDMIERGYRPKPERRKKMDNLRGGSGDNHFAFGHIHDVWIGLEIPENIDDFDDESAKYFGAQAQSRALRNRDDDFMQAWEIEEFLRQRSEYQENEKDIRRRWCLRAELLLQQGKAEDALVSLTGSETGEGGLPGQVSDGVGAFRGDPYYLAPLLKSCALLARGESEYQRYTAKVTSVLNQDHPSQRISYWCALWADEIGLEEDRVSGECLRHIVKMTESPEFGRDAAGIILACELLDLESRGLIDFDSQAFLDRVLRDSAESTREWVEANQPDEEDWLRPLNFNYR